MKCTLSIALTVSLSCIAAAPVFAQKLGVGGTGVGGAYASSDMGKITALALLDGFRKLTVDAQAAIPSK